MIDFMIIGQGLAGSLCAMEALRLGFSVKVVAPEPFDSASAKAAGLMTPIRGKRLTKLWDNHQDLEEVVSHYRELEARLQTDFLKERTLIKGINDPETLRYYRERLEDPEYQPLLGDDVTTQQLYPQVAPYEKTLRIHPVYQVLTAPFLSAVRSYLMQRNSLISSTLTHADLKITPTGLRWKEIEAKQILFCEGHQGRFNPFFKDLEFQCAKGDLIELTIEGLPENTVFNQGTWLAPLGNNHYRFGTNSIWDFQDEVPDLLTVDPLLEEFRRMVKVPFEVMEIRSGIRPAFKKRGALCMTHPTHSQLHLMNGLGGQGTFLGPLLARRFLGGLYKRIL